MIKKTFTILCFMVGITGIFAQKNTIDHRTPVLKDQTYAVKNYPDDGNRYSEKNVSKAAKVEGFHSSLNANTLLSGRKMTADPQTNTSFYIARGGGPFGLTGNDIVVKFTKNFGNSFDSVSYLGTTTQQNRYPGGCIFKDGDDIYVIGCGPITNGLDTGLSWKQGTFLFSSKIDGTNAADIVFAPYEVSDSEGILYWDVNEPYVLPSGELFILSEKRYCKNDTMRHNMGYNIFKFMWNTEDKKFDYVSSYLIEPPTDTVGMPPVQPFGMAFSADGSIGYFWVNTQVDTDIENRYNLQTQPMVYYTDDQGENWNRLELYDFSANTKLTEKLRPVISTFGEAPENYIFRPAFHYGYVNSEQNMPGIVVDDKLFLMATIGSGFSNHPDSLRYGYITEPTMFFLISVTASGEWDVYYVDSVKRKVAEEKNSIYGRFIMDHRPHLSKIENENEALVFTLWTDNHSTSYKEEYNNFPDVFVKAFRFTENFTSVEKSQSRDFTGNTSYKGGAVYMNVSDISLIDSVKAVYQIPVVCANLYYGDPDRPILHEYYKGIIVPFDFDFSSIIDEPEEPEGVKEFLYMEKMEFYPNPATSYTTLSFNSPLNAEAQIQIFNTMGQSICSEHIVLNAGLNQKTIDISHLKSGFYLVNIQIGNTIQTKKLVVK